MKRIHRRMLLSAMAKAINVSKRHLGRVLTIPGEIDQLLIETSWHSYEYVAWPAKHRTWKDEEIEVFGLNPDGKLEEFEGVVGRIYSSEGSYHDDTPSDPAQCLRYFHNIENYKWIIVKNWHPFRRRKPTKYKGYKNPLYAG